MWYLWERMKRVFDRPNLETHLFVQLTPMPFIGPRDNPEGLPNDSRLLFVVWMEGEVADFVSWAGCKAEVDMVRGTDSVYLLLLSDQSTSKSIGAEAKTFVDDLRVSCATRGQKGAVGNWDFVERCRWVRRKWSKSENTEG